MSLTRPESVFDVTRRKVPAKKVEAMVKSKEFTTEEQGLSMTIGNGDSEDREEESLIEPELKSGRTAHQAEKPSNCQLRSTTCLRWMVK